MPYVLEVFSLYGIHVKGEGVDGEGIKGVQVSTNTLPYMLQTKITKIVDGGPDCGKPLCISSHFSFIFKMN